MKSSIIKSEKLYTRCLNDAFDVNGGDIMNALGISIRSKLREGLEVWLYRYKINGVKKATFERLLVSYNLVKNYHISEVQISDVCTLDVQDFINRLRDDCYAYNTIKKAYNIVSAFLKFLIGEGLSTRS